MMDLPKTLYVILTHNEKHMSTDYFENLMYYQEQDNFDLVLLDNGSKKENKSIRTTHAFKNNVYFNGAIQWAWKKMLNNPQYEYLVFSNNDIILHGYKFVRTMVEQMIKGDFAMMSPSLIEFTLGQNYWPAMHCWYKEEPRVTGWIDFTCPFIHRKVVEAIEWPKWWRAPSYGFDDYAAIVCHRNKWKVGVSDIVSVFHYGQHSYRNGLSDLDPMNMTYTHRTNFDWNFSKMGLEEEQRDLDRRKATYGRNNSLKMGRLPSTPEEGYYDPRGKKFWFRNKEEEQTFIKRWGR